MKKTINKQKGFTLVETFVAIIVLTIAVLGPMTLLSRALQDARYIKDQVTATFLAEEGIELVMDYRNNNSNLSTLVPNQAPYSCNLYADQNNFRGYSCNSDPTKKTFVRTVTINQDSPLTSGGPQYLVSSRVTFNRGSVVAPPIIFQSYIFNKSN